MNQIMGDNSTPDASKFSKGGGHNSKFGAPKNTLSRGAKDQIASEQQTVGGATKKEKSRKADLLEKLQANLDSNKSSSSD